MDKLKYVKDKIVEAVPERGNRYRHGQGGSGNQTPLYKKWMAMKRRCLNKNDKSYQRYGGRGITICDKWMDFIGFSEDMGDSFSTGLSLDRIDNTKGYSKENCRWIPLNEQSKNRTVVKLYTHNGITLNASDWDRKLGTKIGTVNARIKNYGWSIEKALTAPKMTYTGVFKDSRGKYRVEVKRNGVKHFVGRYSTLKDAKEARQDFLYNLLK